MPIKDLDELAYGKSEAEKISHLAVLILKHGHRLQTLQNVCDICFDSLPPKFEKHVTEIAEGFANLMEECDLMLTLTDKKTAIQFADTCIRRQKEGEQKLERAASLARGETPETPLDRLISMNLKFNQSEPHTKRAAKKRKKKRSPVAATLPPSNTSFPYMVDGETHTTFHLDEKKVFELPKPTSKEHPNLYSLREIVLHLAPYEGKGKGTRKLIEYLKHSGRITFTKNTVEKYVRKYNKDKELPDEGIMNFHSKVNKTESEPNKKRAAKKRKTGSPVAATSPPSNTSFPYIVDGETHTSFHLDEKKVFELPNPTSKEHPNLYSLREIVLHLAPYEGKGKGIRKLIEYLKKSGRITFTRNTVEKYARKYNKDKELPDEGIMFLTVGRPSARPDTTTSVNEKVNESSNSGLDVIEVAKEQIHAKRREAAHRTTNAKYAGAAALADETVHQVADQHDQFHIQSAARKTAAASEISDIYNDTRTLSLWNLNGPS
jgi:hypothetical protein